VAFTRLRVSPQFAVAAVQDCVIFAGEDGAQVFQGEGYPRALREVLEPDSECLVPTAQSSKPSSGASAELKEFADRGLLVSTSESDDPRASYWRSLCCAPVAGEVEVKHLAPELAHLLNHGLRANGLEVVANADFLIVTADDYLRPELAQIAERRRSWLLAKPVGHTIWLGPLFLPERAPCWFCLESALRANRWIQMACGVPEWREYPPQPSVAALPSTVAMAAGMIAATAAVYLAKGEYPELEGRILTLDTRSMRFAYNLVRRRVDCPHCAGVGGNNREVQDLQDFVSPITGIVSGVDVTERDAAGFFHARARAVRPASTSLRTPLRPSLSIGRGLAAHNAVAGCVAEAIERYSALYQGNELVIRGRFDDLDAFAPNDTLLFSDNQYDSRLAWNAAHSDLHWVPHRFDPDVQIEWTAARSLVTGKTKYFPAGNCYMDFPFTAEPEFSTADTNGCAAGRRMEEAILHGLLELIERDAVAIWWYNRLSRPAVELRSFGDPPLLEIRDAFAQAGLNAYLLDLTTDLGVPAYVAIAPARDGSRPHFGSAAHLVPRIAALQALSEAAQVWFWTSRGGGTQEHLSWLDSATLGENKHLRPAGSVAAQSAEGATTEESIQFCLDRLAAQKIEPYYVDLTRPEVGFPAVRILAPGLRHFWARLGPGRLYDVPVRMGWVGRASTEEETNPIPCMI
jgi:oxazoline/thiazoline synthase